MFKAVFSENVWNLYFGSEKILEYSLDYISWEYILDKAQEYGKISLEESLDPKRIPPEELDTILKWFMEHIWTSQVFGVDLINDFKDLTLAVKSITG